MNYKKIFLITIFLMVPVLVESALPPTGNLISFYNGSQSGGLLLDLSGRYNLTSNLTTYADGEGGYFGSNGPTKYATGTSSPVTGSNFSLYFWIKTADSNLNFRPVSFGENAVDKSVNAYINFNGADVQALTTAGGAIVSQSGRNYNTNDWLCWAGTYNSAGTGTIYFNGESPITGVRSINVGNTYTQIFNDGFYGNMTGLAIYNATHNDTQVADFCSAGHDYNPYASSPAVVSFVSPTPTSGIKNNSQVNYTLSCSGGSNYYLWVNGSLVLSNSTTNYYYSNYTTSANYTATASCFNASSTGNTMSTNVSTYYFYDYTYPVITINDNSEGELTATYTDDVDDILLLNFTFSDDILLYGFEINITNSTGQVNYTLNETLTGTNANHSLAYNSTTWSEGYYTIYVQVADAHTAKAIPSYQITNQKSKIMYKTPNGNNIKIETRDASDIGTLKTYDRYTFNFTFLDGLNKSRTFDIKTDLCPLKYLPESQYKGHFVSYCNHSGNWVDFEGTEYQPTLIFKVDDYHYTIFFDYLPSTITFNSVGGLNLYNSTIYWYNGYLPTTPSAVSGIVTTSGGRPKYKTNETDPIISFLNKWVELNSDDGIKMPFQLTGKWWKYAFMTDGFIIYSVKMWALILFIIVIAWGLLTIRIN